MFTKTEIGWVVWVPQFTGYVCFVGGDWGPQYLTTPLLKEECIFYNKKEAIQKQKEWSGVLKEIRKTTSFELVRNERRKN